MVTTHDREPDVFGAISHPARRRMLDLLLDADRSVNAIAGEFQMSRPAVSQHLRVLLDTGLVTEQRHGRERRYRLVPERLAPRTQLARTLRAVLGRPASSSAGAPGQKEQAVNNTVRRELVVPQPREQVWQALTTSAALADWMFPNDFEPRVGHQFTFRVPGNPKLNFDGLTVNCEVLECDRPHRLVFTWSAGGAVVDTRVSFRLEPDGDGTPSFSSIPASTSPIRTATRRFAAPGYGWGKMLENLRAVIAVQVI